MKNVSNVDARGFAQKSNLASLKPEVDKIDPDKLKTVPVDLAKLNNVVKMMLDKTYRILVVWLKKQILIPKLLK